jgi:hypothetical protein
MSPPKEPIVFYIEHTTPVRYRRWVREGIMAWNRAFEKVGLVNALEVYIQDAQSGLHMDKDPEDVRYNFVRWLNNDLGMAIGPSRVNPLTGQILDADIILTDGWIRHYRFQFEDLLPKIAMDGFGPETLAWLSSHPQWDPRVRMARPAEQQHQALLAARQGGLPHAGHPIGAVDSRLIGDDPFDGLIGRSSQCNGLCLAADGKALDVALMRMMLAMSEKGESDRPASGEGVAEADDNGGGEDDDKDEEKKDKQKEEEEKKDEESLIDGMPESFVGQLLADLVAHEVGHTLGLRHNFKASGAYPLADINSEKMKGKMPLASSVMDYTPVNINIEGGSIQGDYAMLGVGPYDIWAIEYGYSFAGDLKPILNRVAERELSFATDEDTWGPDPLARRYDFSENPIEYARDQMRLAKHHRERLLEKFVKDGESWSRARRGYLMTLTVQARAVGMMANWVGGVYVHRDKKGDKDARVPLDVVPAQKQREALEFVLENAFKDDAYGLNAQLLSHMTVDKWLDGDFHFALDDPDWPIHDQIMGLQASTLTMIMNPTTLRRVYDNEYRVPPDQDMLTLPELMDAVSKSIWKEIEGLPEKSYTARMPLISSLRRNLQREHLERLIDLSLPGAGSGAAYKPISNLAVAELRAIRGKADRLIAEGGEKVDPYTRAHLTEASERIARALDAQYIYNTQDIGGRILLPFFFGQQPPGALPENPERLPHPVQP